MKQGIGVGRGDTWAADPHFSESGLPARPKFSN